MYMITPVDQLTFAWQNVNGSPTFAPVGLYPKFPSVGGWGASTTGVLEVVIYPIGSTIHTTNPDANRLVDQARTFYLYPGNGGGTANFANDDGQVINGNCSGGNVPKYCLVTIGNMPNSGNLGSNGYVIRVRSIYNSASLQINGQLGGSNVNLEGVQRVIDVTGRASDVLRRVQVRLPIRPSYNLPIFSIEAADDICKLLYVYPSPGNVYPPTYDPDSCT